jgi:type II secretory pathway pseudopilin PulG
MPARRSAYTLFEVLLVVAVIVLLAGLSYPSLTAMQDNFRMIEAADQVRACWAAARARAINESQPYRFAIVPDSGNYRLAPDAVDHWLGAGGAVGPEEGGSAPLVIDAALPRGVRFRLRPPSEGDSGGESFVPPGTVDTSAWQTLVTFLPDGSARQDAQVVLNSANARPAVLRLRALTGTATARPYRP